MVAVEEPHRKQAIRGGEMLTAKDDAGNTLSSNQFLMARLRRIRPGAVDVAEIAEILDALDASAIAPGDILDIARSAIMHGLVEKGLDLLRKLNLLHPEYEEGWKEHVRVLEFLQRMPELLSLRVQAESVMGRERAEAVLGRSPIYEESSGIAAHAGSREEDPSLAPFRGRVRRAEDLRCFAAIFKGRSDCFARQWVDRKKGAQGYVPERRPMTISDIEDHLSGRCTYGIYLMEKDNNVSLGVIDIDLVKRYRSGDRGRPPAGDLKREISFLIRHIYRNAEKHRITLIAEFSGGKGYHLWFPVDAPVPASARRKALALLIRDAASGLVFFQLEIFPKQDRLAGKGLGNLVKLPLGIHRGSGKRSYLLGAGGKDEPSQLAFLHSIVPTPAERILEIAERADTAEIVQHPATRRASRKFPVLEQLIQGCFLIGRVVRELLHGRSISERERRVVIWTIAHLKEGREIIHHLFSNTPDYSRPLLDYELSQVRGTPLGCKKIHGLLGQGDVVLPCTFQLKKGEYRHPLLHLDEWTSDDRHPPKAERIVNLQDAISNLKAAISAVERYLA